jgi:hypothetical protein
VFTGLCLTIGNFNENLSILTGFPFGHYHFTEVMGPKILHVPVFLGMAYVGMGYVSWILGLLIAGDVDGPLKGRRVVTRPLIAAGVMVAWDLSMDAVWSNIGRGWVWHDGGAYFGVPVSNFLGWYFTVYCIYQVFAVYLVRRSTGGLALPRTYWRQAVAVYAVSAAGNLLVAAPGGVSEVTDAVGTVWRVHSILVASAVVSVLVMGGIAAVAWVRIPREEKRLAAAGGVVR